MRTCAGSSQPLGRATSQLWVKSIDGKTRVKIPFVRECDDIPDNPEEIPSPDVAQNYPHLRPIADQIQPYDPCVPILLLIGRDVIQVHKVREQINGPGDSPFAQRLDLGWVIVGESCLHAVHKPKEWNVYRTSVTVSGRPSYFSPCLNTIEVTRSKGEDVQDVFTTTKHDEKQALSLDDLQFLDIMQQGIHQDDGGSWVAPLPVRYPRRPLPNNKDMARRRLASLRKTMLKKPIQ